MSPLARIVLFAACALAFAAMPMRAQDDNGGPPPPQDNASQPAQENAAPDDTSAEPDSSASFQTFYDSLSSQGTWIQSADYGYVWQPQVTDPEWAPYTLGHWVYSDEGWTWVSDESFGWATYHYGRWVNLDNTGWCWVPGYTWAPAWVSWRYGDGYAGWAPLPPDSFVGVDYSDDGFSIGVGFHIGGDCDGFYGIGAGCYNFIPVNCLGYRNYHGYYRHRGDNFAIINRTTNVTNINVTRGGAATAGTRSFHRVTAGGPMLEQVDAASSTPIQKVNLVRASQPEGGGRLSGNSLAIFAPHVNAGANAQPARVSGSIGKSNINRGADVMRPLAVNSVLTGSAATESQVQQARIAQNHAPASAKVMTDESTVRPVLQAPLTSLHPVTRDATSRTFTPTANGFSNAPVVAPTARTYPQTVQPGGVPTRTYYPNTVAPSASPSYPTHPAQDSPSFVRPSPSAPVTPSAPIIHQSQGGNSSGGGGYSNGGGNSGGNNSGANRGASGSSGNGGYHSGGNSQQNH